MCTDCDRSHLLHMSNFGCRPSRSLGDRIETLRHLIRRFLYLPARAPQLLASQKTGRTACPHMSHQRRPALRRKNNQQIDKNVKAVKHLVGQIPLSLMPFFQCELSAASNGLCMLICHVATIRLFQPRRSTDPMQRQRAKDVGNLLAEILDPYMGQMHFW